MYFIVCCCIDGRGIRGSIPQKPPFQFAVAVQFESTSCKISLEIQSFIGMNVAYMKAVHDCSKRLRKVITRFLIIWYTLEVKFSRQPSTL